MHNHEGNNNHSKMRYLIIILLAVAGLYIALDHGQHLVPYLPFAFLLGCFFMHAFMHGGHNNHEKK